MLDLMSSATGIPDPSARGLAAAADLAGRVAGEVRMSPLSRWLYSTDASIYRVIPDAVLVARAVADLAAAAEVAERHGVPLCVRGAATSLAGQTLGAGIAVDCFHLDRILGIDPDRRVARVEPGVVQGALNRAAAPGGLEFGPDTSTVEQATIGGMVGNNSSGSRSIVYGETKDKLRRLSGVLVGGEAVSFGPGAAGDLTIDRTSADGRSTRGGSAPSGALADGLAALRARIVARGLADFPRTARRVSGYNLPELLAPEPNPARLFAGSEGTLMLFTEIEVELDARPQSRPLAALTFASLRDALEANLAILTTGPSAVELIDLEPLRGSPNLRRFTRLGPILGGEEPAVLLVEYQGTRDEGLAGLDRLRAVMPDLGVRLEIFFADPAEVNEAWELRRASLPLLMGAPGVERPASFVEDTAVPPEHLADYVDEFRRIVAAHGVRASFTGHASAGCMHVRPMLDLKSTAGVGHLQGIAAEVGRLVAAYHGALSGEHGDGFSRSWFNAELFGADTYADFVALKDLFDPRRLLSPGRKVEGPAVAENLRFGAGYRGRSGWRPRLSYAREGGYELAVERCFGAGLCRKQIGTMCPPAAATREEWHTTRARANLLQAIVAGAVAPGDLADDEFEEVLGTCLACKACSAECPAAVDMAALKAEWLAELNARDGVPLLARAVADLGTLMRLAAPFAPLVNALGRGPLARALMPLAGVDPRRAAPQIARRSFSERARAAAVPASGGAAVAGTGARTAAMSRAADVVVFADCFIEHQEPHIGAALLTLLRAAGYTPAVARAGCCGRTMLSVGMIDKARRAAQLTARALAPQARAGLPIVFIEPSCQAMVCDDWERLLPGDDDAAVVAAAARSGLALVADAATAGRLKFIAGGSALVHPHCHERAVFGVEDTMRALRCVPELELTVLDAGCCGMSGIFGYRRERYELSVQIASRALLPAVRGAGREVAVLATGTSCRSQIGDLAARPARHPLEFLAERLAT
jgi:FAD/FMN-containing dehydrogenase/Fe-S oxidoreductase